MKRIGVDTGGTFTDFVFFRGDTIETLKLPSTPKNPESSVLQGVEPFIKDKIIMIYGTTIATNSLLQKKMAKSAFLCTKGFEHILHIGRQNRINLFSLNVKKPSSIVPLSLCYGIDERTSKDGIVKKRPKKSDIIELCKQLKSKKVKSVGVVFLHSYKNPKNEKFITNILRNFGFYVTASYEIMPEYREYERAVVTILNSALKPIVADYINSLNDSLAGNSFYIIQSNGGILSPERIVKEPIRTIISGPAGGVIAAKKISESKNISNIITFDMGGTSTDVSVIKNGELTQTKDGNIENLPLRIPMIDIATVGAGGGSIARIDKGGVLQVGPESAGADPGPSCYGKLDLPTVTDAFVVNGVIDPELFLGGKMKIYPKKSFKAIEKIAKKIGKTIYQTAEGIILISISSMERALRSMTIEKGEDPRFYTLLPFGGAGGMVATLLAGKLGINQILIPPFQGVFSAFGMLFADFQKEFSRSLLKMYSHKIEVEIEEIFSGMNKIAQNILKDEGFSEKKSKILNFLEIRYKGQSYELTVSYKKGFIKKFHKKHQQLYSYSLGDDNCEIVNLRVLAIGKTKKLRLEKREIKPGYPKILARRKVYFSGKFENFNFYRRKDLDPGHSLRIPAIVISDHSTIIINKTFNAHVDEYSNIILQRN